MSSISKTKISDLVACYHDLLNGMSLEELFDKYIHIEVLVAQELFEKGVTLRELEEFVRTRDAHVESMLSSPLKKVVTFSKRLMRK